MKRPAWPTAERDALVACYRDGLLDDVVPFWVRHAPDPEHGGFHFSVDRRGVPINRYKSVSLNARFVWLLSTLYRTVEPRADWLELAASGLRFLDRFALADDGCAWSLLDRRGRPVRKDGGLLPDRYLVLAKAAFGRATGDEARCREAATHFERILARLGSPPRAPLLAPSLRHRLGWGMRYLTVPGLLRPEGAPLRHACRRLLRHLARPGRVPRALRRSFAPAQTLVHPMLTLLTAREVRATGAWPAGNRVIDEALGHIRLFVDDARGLVREALGSARDMDELLQPGHSITVGWLVLQEAKHRGMDDALLQLGLRLVDYSWAWGWDQEMGGLHLRRHAAEPDARGGLFDAKLWWCQNEAIVATLLAYQLTGEEKYKRWHRQVHDWAHRYGPDPVHGEWFGYYRRDGRTTYQAKGSLGKGALHLPRMQWTCWRLLEAR